MNKHTHEGYYYGIPVWASLTDDEVDMECKIKAFSFLIDWASYIELFIKAVAGYDMMFMIKLREIENY